MANSFIGQDMAVDLGTANTLVYVRGKGVLLDEPSVVALNSTTGEILAVGHEAEADDRAPRQHHRDPPAPGRRDRRLRLRRADARFFIQRVHRRRYFAKPRPGDLRAERHHRRGAARGEGGRLEPGPAVCTSSSRWPPRSARPARPRGHRQHGRRHGGTTEVAVISLGGIVTSLSIRTAGDDLDQAIIAWMKKEYSLMLGERTAEEIR